MAEVGSQDARPLTALAVSSGDMEPAARLFEATCRVLLDDVLLFDPLERHGCPHAELEAVSDLQAAMAFGYAEVAVHAGRPDLFPTALALACPA